MEEEAIKNYIKHLEENLVADDPKYKEKSNKIADIEAKLNKYKKTTRTF